MKRVIFNDNVCDYLEACKSDIIDNLESNGEEVNDNTIYEEAQRLINFDCEDLKEALKIYDKQHNRRVLGIASLGLWNGRFKGGKILDNLSSALNACEDTNTLYCERKNGTLKLKAIHHDGTNYFSFYEITDKGERFIEQHTNMEREALHNALRKNGRSRNIHFEIAL